jgi:hypothetical protein
MSGKVVYFPVPTINREVKVVPPKRKGSTVV